MKKFYKLLFFIAVLVLGCVHLPNKNQAFSLPDLVINSDQNFLEIVPASYEPIGLLSLDGHDSIIKIFRYSEVGLEESKDRIKNKSHEVQLLFERTVEPYFGTVNDESACLKESNLIESAPIEQQSYLIKQIKLQATNRFVLLACANNDKYPKAEIILLYCKKNRSLFEIRIFNKIPKVELPYIAIECN